MGKDSGKHSTPDGDYSKPGGGSGKFGSPDKGGKHSGGDKGGGSKGGGGKK